MPSDLPPLIFHPQEATPDGFMEFSIESGGVPVRRDVVYCSRFDDRLSEAEKMERLRQELCLACNDLDALQRENEALHGIRRHLLSDLQWYDQERERLLAENKRLQEKCDADAKTLQP